MTDHQRVPGAEQGRSDPGLTMGGDSAVGRRVIGGAAWMMGMRLALRGAGVINVAVLARVLVPADFGLIAIVMSLLVLPRMLVDTVTRAPLVRLNSVTPAHFAAARRLRVGLALALGAIVWLSAPALADFYQVAALEAGLMAIAAVVVLEGLENPGVVSLQRDMRWRRDAAFEVAVGAARIAATIALTLWLRSFWGVILGALVAAMVRVGLSYALAPRPAGAVTRSLFRALWGVSRWSLGEVLADMASGRSDRLLLGRLAGVAPMGLFSLAKDLALVPHQLLIMPVGRALLPGLRQARGHDPARRGRLFSLALGSFGALAVPSAVGAALVADPFVRALLGDDYAGAVPVLVALAPALAFEGLSSAATQIMVVEGRLATVTGIKVARLLGYVALLLPAFHGAGLVGVALAKSGMDAFVTLALLVVLAIRMPVDWRHLGAALARTALAATGMAATVLALMPLVAGWTNVSALQLLMLVPAGAMAYGAGLLGIWWLTGRPDGLEARILAVLARS
ncbi:oligosaccharide flippase family protein [Yunchengibacter salinarum]|uniref:oligosaccharide flippase family protein n=1 Tax=Yunchengibacter salinarum TaxID=3133399 RepID=UPI0035B5F2D1